MHHTNTKSYTTSIVGEFLEKGKIEALAHPIYKYSADFAPYNFWVFGDLKWELRNRLFESNAKLMAAVNCFFQVFPLEEFHKMMTVRWKERMPVCIVNDSGYFEKDIVDRDDDE